MFPTPVRTLLVGSDERKSKRWSVLVGLLLGGSLRYFAALNAVTHYSWPVHLALWWDGYAVLLGTLVVGTYATDALVVSWRLAFAAVFGLAMNYGGLGVARLRRRVRLDAVVVPPFLGEGSPIRFLGVQ